MFQPVLVWDVGKCTVSIINIYNNIEEPTCGHQNCNSSQILIFGGYDQVRESLYTRVIIWVITILNHIDTMGVLAWCIDLNGVENKIAVKYPYLTGINYIWVSSL